MLNWGGTPVKEESTNWFSVEKHEGNSNVKGNWIVCYSQTLLISRTRATKGWVWLTSNGKPRVKASKPFWQHIKRVSCPQREVRETWKLIPGFIIRVGQLQRRLNFQERHGLLYHSQIPWGRESKRKIMWRKTFKVLKEGSSCIGNARTRCSES